MEGALHRHPTVAEAGVFSIPDERLGEAVGGAIQLKMGMQADAEELTAFLKGQIAGLKFQPNTGSTKAPCLAAPPIKPTAACSKHNVLPADGECF